MGCVLITQYAAFLYLKKDIVLLQKSEKKTEIIVHIVIRKLYRLAENN